ncbi:hypothetical protein OF83DRAFT_324706 [Amylostereum chailletii]|nr:hypothetical protein OF83DRAFT_324706 [Amylostereum chailletii]
MARAERRTPTAAVLAFNIALRSRKQVQAVCEHSPSFLLVLFHRRLRAWKRFQGKALMFPGSLSRSSTLAISKSSDHARVCLDRPHAQVAEHTHTHPQADAISPRPSQALYVLVSGTLRRTRRSAALGAEIESLKPLV